MEDQNHRRREGDAVAELRAFSSEEEARLKAVMVPYAVVSLVLQGLLLVVGIRTVRAVYGGRHLGAHPRLRSAGGPLLGLVVLNLAQIVADRRLRRWIKRILYTAPD